MTVPAQSGDLYFTYETYFQSMIPLICNPFAHVFNVNLLKNNVLIEDHEYTADWNVPMLVLEANYAAGDVFKMIV